MFSLLFVAFVSGVETYDFVNWSDNVLPGIADSIVGDTLVVENIDFKHSDWLTTGYHRLSDVLNSRPHIKHIEFINITLGKYSDNFFSNLTHIESITLDHFYIEDFYPFASFLFIGCPVLVNVSILNSGAMAYNIQKDDSIFLDSPLANYHIITENELFLNSIKYTPSHQYEGYPR